MIGRNKTWLDNLYIQEQLTDAFEEGHISEEEFDNVIAAHPEGFYNPHFFVSLGLFLLTVVIVSFAFGLFSLIFIETQSSKMFGSGAVFFGFLVYGVLEMAIKKVHYRSGVDTALLWIAPVLIVAGLNLGFDISPAWNAVIILLLSVYGTLRFADALMSVVAFTAFLSWCLITYSKLGGFAEATSAFLIMALSAVIYFIARKEHEKESLRHYKICLMMMEMASLVYFYAAGNYYVAREAGNAMFHWQLTPGGSIPLGWLFWMLTVVIPIVYLLAGIQKKDLLLVRVGLVVLAAMIFTIRYYYPILPTEWALVAGGVLLISVAWSLIRYLKEPQFGFTSKENPQKSSNSKGQLESWAIASIAVPGQSQPSGGTQFGGGTGSGGGAGDSF